MKAKGWTGFLGITTQADFDYAMSHAHETKTGKDFNWQAQAVNPFVAPPSPFDNKPSAAAVAGGPSWTVGDERQEAVRTAATLTPEQLRLRNMQGFGASRDAALAAAPTGPPQFGGLLGELLYPQQAAIGRPGGPGSGAGNAAMAAAAMQPVKDWAERQMAANAVTPVRAEPTFPNQERDREWSTGVLLDAAQNLVLQGLSAVVGRERLLYDIQNNPATGPGAYAGRTSLYGRFGATDASGAPITDASGAPETRPTGSAAVGLGGNRQQAERDIENRPRIDPSAGIMDIERPGEVSPWYSRNSVPDRMSGAMARVMEIAIRNADMTGDIGKLPLRVTDVEQSLLEGYLTNDLKSKGMKDLEYNPETKKWEYTRDNIFGSNTQQTLEALGYEYLGAGYGWLLKPQLGGAAGVSGDGGSRGWGGYGGYGGGGRGYGSSEQGILWRIGIT
jgi:hypothetical protein